MFCCLTVAKFRTHREDRLWAGEMRVRVQDGGEKDLV